MGIFAGKIRGAGADTDGEHGGDGTRTVAGDAVREAFSGAERRDGTGGGVFYIVEAGAGRRAGTAVFVLYDTAAGDFVYRGIVYRGFVRAGAAQFAARVAESGDDGLHEMALVSAAEFREFQRDGHGRARPRGSRGTYPAAHAVYSRLLHHRPGNCQRRVFAAQFKMRAPKSKAWLLLLIVPLGFEGIWRLQHSIDGQRAALSQERDDVLLRSGRLLKVMSLEYAPLLADIYWTRVVQYYGNKHVRKDANLELLWPLLDITTTLDPNLLVAYRFGAAFLSPRAPGGAGRPDLAVQLIQRGIQANPEYWRLYEDLGFVYYFDMKDYNKASEAFLEGSKKPSAYLWMKVMAAKIAAEGESYATSLFLWNDIYESTPDPLVKKNAELHLRLLRVREDCKHLDALADEYAKRYAKRPTRMNELVWAGLLPGIPADPLGFAYIFSDEGKAELNLDSPLLEQQLLLERFSRQQRR